MVDDARRNRTHLEVSHLICSHYHCTFLLTECIDNLSQCIRTTIDIVAVKLHGKFSALFTMDGKIPASSDSKIILSRDNVNYATVSSRHLCKKFCRSVSRMVIYDYDIERTKLSHTDARRD